MNLQNYTSLELSKKLAENGCNYLKPSMFWQIKGKEINLVDKMYNHSLVDYYYPAYDLLWDICCRYAKKFFGEHLYSYETQKILSLLQQGEKEIVEKYIWLHCKFNPKNK